MSRAASGTEIYVRVVRCDEIEVGAMVLREVHGKPIALARTTDGVTAFPATCPHAAFTFVPSVLVDGCEIECPMHGARFDASTGELRCGPAKTGLERLACRVVDDHVEVAVAEPDEEAPDGTVRSDGHGLRSSVPRDEGR